MLSVVRADILPGLIEIREGNMRSHLFVAGSIVALGVGAGQVAAQTPAAKGGSAYPSKSIRIVVPYPPGGTSDILSRLIGAKVTENWSQQVVVDNRTGANGNIGAEHVARSAPDGYTLMVTDIGNLSIAPNVYKLPFDILKDYVPITTISYSPHLFVTHPSVPVKTVTDVIAVAKARPGKLNFPTGIGGAPHFAGIQFEQRTGVKWTYIPTRGGADSSRMVMGGEADLMFLGMLQTIPHVKSGRLKLIAVSSEKRIASLPDTPTVGEGPGLKGFYTGSWQGMLAPSKTPPEVVSKLNSEMVRVLALADIKEKLGTQGTEPVANSSQDTARWMANETQRMGKLIKDTGFKME
jgi:tripartite-type tricarboxylate transporter receptor subunit TctC